MLTEAQHKRFCQSNQDLFFLDLRIHKNQGLPLAAGYLQQRCDNVYVCPQRTGCQRRCVDIEYLNICANVPDSV